MMDDFKDQLTRLVEIVEANSRRKCRQHGVDGESVRH